MAVAVAVVLPEVAVLSGMVPGLTSPNLMSRTAACAWILLGKFRRKLVYAWVIFVTGCWRKIHATSAFVNLSFVLIGIGGFFFFFFETIEWIELLKDMSGVAPGMSSSTRAGFLRVAEAGTRPNETLMVQGEMSSDVKFWMEGPLNSRR